MLWRGIVSLILMKIPKQEKKNFKKEKKKEEEEILSLEHLT